MFFSPHFLAGLGLLRAGENPSRSAVCVFQPLWLAGGGLLRAGEIMRFRCGVRNLFFLFSFTSNDFLKSVRLNQNTKFKELTVLNWVSMVVEIERNQSWCALS